MATTTVVLVRAVTVAHPQVVECLIRMTRPTSVVANPAPPLMPVALDAVMSILPVVALGVSVVVVTLADK